jgi:hypothetical protein
MSALAVEDLRDQPAFTLWETTYSLTDPRLVGDRPGAGMILMAEEAEWVKWLLAFGRLHGWMMTFANDPARNVPARGDWGFPDGVAVRGHRIEFIEAKSETGFKKHAYANRSPDQKRWGERLTACAATNPNIAYRLWAPRHAWEAMEVLA